VAKDFKAKQLRTTQVIASGSAVGTTPSLLIYSASRATNVDGGYAASMTSTAGSDVWMFVDGTKNDTGLANESHSGKVLFAGDVVVSGTLYAEKQILEVDLSQNSDLFLSGALVLGDQGVAPNGDGQTRLFQTIGNNSGSLFVSTGSVYLGAKSGGVYRETEITPKVIQADNGIGSQIISATNTSLHLDINSLTGSLTNSNIADTDLFAVADVGGTNEVKKITLGNVATKLAGDGISAGSGILAAQARNGIAVTSNGIEVSLTDISGSSSIATGDSIPFLDTDGSTQISTVAQLVTALAGDGISNLGNQFQASVDGSTVGISGGNITVRASGITGTQLNTSVAGNGLTGGAGSALSLDLNELSAADVAVSADSIAIIDADDNSSKKESIADLVTGIAGTASATGISAASGVLSVDINALAADSNAGNLADSIAISDNSDSNSNKKITLTQLKALVDTDTTYTAGDGLNLGGTEFSLDLKSSGGLKITSAELEVEPSDFAGTGLEDDGSDNLRIAASAAGSGLTGGGGSPLALDNAVVQKTIYAVTGSGTHGFGTANAPSASNTDSFAIGRRSVASGNYSVAIGASQSTNNNTASGLSAAALGGDNATASGDYSAVLGGSGNTASGNYAAVIGRSSTAAGENSIAIGKSLTATEADSVAIGNSTNNAKIALSGSVEVFSTSVFNDDVSILGGGDLFVNTFIKHYGDNHTRFEFLGDEIRTTVGGLNNVIVKTDQILILSGGSANSSNNAAAADVAFYVSGSTSSQGTTTKGTTLLDGDVFVSGSLRGPTELQFGDNSSARIFRDGSVLKFDDASNDVKTLSQLASTGVSAEHFVGVHGGSPATSKLKTTASVAFAGASDNFVDGLAGEGVGADTFVFFSGSIGSRGTTTRGVTLFGGDSVFSGSATYLGTTAFTDLTATGDITAGASFVANGNTVKNSNGDKVFKFSSGTGAALMGDGSIIDSTTPSAFLHIENAENVQAAATNETANFNILLRNSTVQTNAFAGIAFDVSTELDADSIGAAIRAERDTSAGTTVGNHATNLTFATNNTGDDALTERMRITHDGKVGIGVEPGYALDVSGDVRIRGNDIRDNSGNVFISGDGSANTVVANDLTVSGGDIFGPTDGDLNIKSDGNITFIIDNDNDESSQGFLFKNNTSSDVFEITESGDIQAAGDLTVGGNDIKDSGGNTVISFDGSGNIDNNVDFTGTVDFEGIVHVSQYIQHLSDTNTRLVFNDDQINIEVGGVGFMSLTENDSQDTIVFNEGSNDIDFRVESNNEDYMFFVDAGTNRIGMGISGPAATLEVKGATADETTILLRDSNSSDIIAKLYHENGEDDGVLDLYANGAVTARIHGNGDSFINGGDLSIGEQLSVVKGIPKSASVLCNSSIDTNEDRFFKIATIDTTITNQKQAKTTILVTMAGPEVADIYGADDTFLLHVEYAASNASPYYQEQGTFIRVDTVSGATDLEDFDPATDVVMTFSNTGLPTQIDLYIKSRESHRTVYTSILGGTTSQVPGGTQYAIEGFRLLSGQTPAAAITSLGTDVFGTWVSKYYSAVSINGGQLFKPAYASVKLTSDTDNNANEFNPFDSDVNGSPTEMCTAAGITFTASTGRFTITEAGAYEISANIFINGSQHSGNLGAFKLEKNGSTDLLAANPDVSVGADTVELNLNGIFDFAASDYVEFKIDSFNGLTSQLNVDQGSTLTIKRVG